jgi:hypothetical protein
MKRYVEHGTLPGHFLRAAISNKLTEAFLRADDVNTARMREVAMFLYDEMPPGSWGSEEKMLAWSKAKQEGGYL